jgi:O-antigen/teichoic acid export membrane protein
MNPQNNFRRFRSILHKRSRIAWNYLCNSTLINNLAVFGSSNTIAQFIMMVYTIILARVLGPSALGVYAGAYSISGLSIAIVNWGMDTWLLRESGIVGNPRKLSGIVLTIKFGAGFIWALALVILLPTIRPDLFSTGLMIVVVLDIWADVCFNTSVAALNALQKMREISWLLMISRIGRLLGLISVAMVGIVSPLPIAMTRGFATILSFVGALILLRPQFNLVNLREMRIVVVHSLPYGLSDFLSLIYANADVTMLNLIAGEQAVGNYSPATGIVHALFIVPNAIFTVIVPVISNFVKNDVHHLYRETRRILLGFGAIGLVLWGVIGPGGDLIIHILLGEAYRVTGNLLEILSPILFMKSIEFGFAAILVAVGWQKKRLIPQAISAAANVLVNLWAIPRFNVFGVAWVYVFSEAIIFVGYGWLVWQWVKDIRGLATESNVQ